MVMIIGYIFPMYGDDDVVQHFSCIIKPGPQDIFFHWKRRKKKNTGSNIHRRNHEWYSPPGKPFIPGGMSTLHHQLLGILLK